MFDFEKFAKPFRCVAPVRNGSFIWKKKSYRIKTEDGWFLIEIKNNDCRVVEPALPTDVLYFSLKNNIKGYTHHNSIIFQNTDVAKRRFGLGMTAPLHFSQSQTFEAIEAVVWEDKEVYWIGPNYGDTKIFDIKDAYDQERVITDLKGVTPELRMLYIHHAIERESMRKMLEEAKKKEEIESLMASIPGRLQVTFDRAGATMTNYSISGSRIVVDWTIPGSHYQYNSVIDSSTWMIIEAGYCMSGDDRRHNITSMVKTAQLYTEQHGRVNITRSTGDPEEWDRNNDDDWD